ncbi:MULTISPECIES: TetR/AcrR family transcriptional regulator [Paenibacillus]|uniref:TetR family transcriptional regulator n=1 Tax=Paenibacillus campinasensis TaxID=66347 RepID=A0A268EDX6_9BACL|nr:TetR/AcrR family transcriptional regulator [Paenibacillus campinasensis]MUG65386.1 TetR family transcriptional regulator [Paenibacillus campinasensis]PAD71324.1 TetR family transcriptional regulator [Paenibacillus campinasensis]
MSPRPGLDQTAVVQAAARLADRDGFHAVTLASLAAELGVRSPSLYNHINGLPGLHAALTLHGLRTLLQGLMKAVVGKSGEDALRQACLAYVEFARTHPGLYEAALQPIAPEQTEVIQAGDSVVELLLQILTPYKLTTDDALHTVRCIRSFCHGFCSLERSGQFAMNLNRDDSLAFMIDVFIQGMNLKAGEV